MSSRPVESGIRLRRSPEAEDEIEALATLAGGRVGLAGLLTDLSRHGHSARAPGRLPTHGFAWDLRDGTSVRWWPQGVTTSGDAHPGGSVEGRSLLMTSWYSREIGHLHEGSRLSVVDLATLRYQHVLLVRPVLRDGRVDLEPLKVHAGGLVWYGPYVHVAATGRGFHTAHLDDLVRLPDAVRDPHHHRIGRTEEGRLAAFGYRYVLPVRFTYRSHSDDGVPRMRYSFASLDRTSQTPAIVVGEYGRGAQTTRLARFDLDPGSHHLTTSSDGFSHPSTLHADGERLMQGAAVVDGRWYLTSSRSWVGQSSMYAGRPGRFSEHARALPAGCEDLCYWPERDEFWTLAEHPGRRHVCSVPRSALD